MARAYTASRENAALRNCRGWIAAAIGLTVLAWVAGLAGLLAVANRVHNDIPAMLAAKLPLLRSQPELIFAGDSRTNYQVDPILAAEIMGKPSGAAANIAYEAGDPMSVLAAMKRLPDRFRLATLVISFPPFLFNEGVHGAGSHPLAVTARLSVFEQITTFLPMRVGTLIRYVREAFNSEMASAMQVPERGELPPDFGVIRLKTPPNYPWPADMSSHAFYERWDISGLKAEYELSALCEMASLTHRFIVVFPPFAPRYDRALEPLWRDKDAEVFALTIAASRRCGFEVLDIPSIPGLLQEHFFDESHINSEGIPIYTRYVMSQIKP
jgi:hypothetical protein